MSRGFGDDLKKQKLFFVHSRCDTLTKAVPNINIYAQGHSTYTYYRIFFGAFLWIFFYIYELIPHSIDTWHIKIFCLHSPFSSFLYVLFTTINLASSVVKMVLKSDLFSICIFHFKLILAESSSELFWSPVVRLSVRLSVCKLFTFSSSLWITGKWLHCLFCRKNYTCISSRYFEWCNNYRERLI